MKKRNTCDLEFRSGFFKCPWFGFKTKAVQRLIEFANVWGVNSVYKVRPIYRECRSCCHVLGPKQNKQTWTARAPRPEPRKRTSTTKTRKTVRKRLWTAPRSPDSSWPPAWGWKGWWDMEGFSISKSGSSSHLWVFWSLFLPWSAQINLLLEKGRTLPGGVE